MAADTLLDLTGMLTTIGAQFAELLLGEVER